MTRIDPKLLEAAFARIAEHGMAGLDLAALAEAEGRGLEEVVTALGGPAGVTRALGHHLDAAMLGIAPDELAGLSTRERLFELLMRRFEAMRPFRDGLKRLMRDRRGDPGAPLTALCNLERASARLLDAAGVQARGTTRMLVQAGLVAVYASSFRVWLNDTSTDLSATMAELDKRLQQAERFAAWLPGHRRRETAAEAA